MAVVIPDKAGTERRQIGDDRRNEYAGDDPPAAVWARCADRRGGNSAQWGRRGRRGRHGGSLRQRDAKAGGWQSNRRDHAPPVGAKKNARRKGGRLSK